MSQFHAKLEILFSNGLGDLIEIYDTGGPFY